MSSLLSRQQIKNLPKIDLHRHLDCSMRFSTMLEIATDLKIDFPQNEQQQKEFFLVTKPMTNLESVLNKFLTAQRLLFSEEILERLAFEACEDAYLDGVRILELRYAPTFITSRHPHLTFEKIHNAFLKGTQRAIQKYPLATGLICIIQRTLSLAEAERVMDFAIENKNTFIGVDLADNEIGFEPAKFQKLFSKAKNAGLHITIHTGEAPDTNSEKWMIDAIELLGAERIGHGVQSVHSPKVISLLKEKNITLEICPYSNYLTQAFKTFEENPLKKLKNLGVPVTLNSDDPGIFNSVLSDEYEIAQKYLDFNLMDFSECNQTAFNASFIPFVEKAKIWSQAEKK